MKPLRPESSLFTTIKKSEFKSIGIDSVEKLLDANTADEILREIPIIKTIYALATVGLTFRDYRFAKKMCAFLKNLEDMPQPVREQQVDKLLSDPDERERVGACVLQLIDAASEVEKAELLGRFFLVFLEEKITKPELLRLIHALGLVDFQLMDDLIKFYVPERQTSGIDEEILQALSISGLVFQKPDSGAIGDGGGYFKSKLGAMFVKHGIDL